MTRSSISSAARGRAGRATSASPHCGERHARRRVPAGGVAGRVGDHDGRWLLRHRARTGTKTGRSSRRTRRVAGGKSAVSIICVTPPRRRGTRLVGGKFVVATSASRWSLARRVQAERGDVAWASPQVFVVRMVACGFGTSCGSFCRGDGLLDFYHASQHLWDLAHTLHPDNEAGARRGWSRCCISCGTAAKPGAANLQDWPTWCVQRAQAVPRRGARNQLLHGNIGASPLCGARGEGCPIGQRRDGILVRATPRPFKRGGQFWTEPGVAASCPRSRPSQPRLERSLAVQIKNSVKMHPCDYSSSH